MKKPHRPPAAVADEADDDDALWRDTAKSLEPLRRAKGRVHPAVSNTPVAVPTPERMPEGSQPNKAVVQRDVSAPARAASPLADFDRKKARKLRGGREDIDASIDLHGMRQDEAHVALRRFLTSSFAKGRRNILVITGKGGPRKPAEDDSTIYGARETGVLRRNVPRWLAEPELRAIVVSYTEAAVQHGGQGALYVHLRRNHLNA